jgi:hypothetical protein
LLEAREE